VAFGTIGEVEYKVGETIGGTGIKARDRMCVVCQQVRKKLKQGK